MTWPPPRPDVSIVQQGEDVRCITIAADLRRAGISVETSWNGKIKSQLKRATGSWIIIAERGELRLRDSRNGRSTPASEAEIVAALIDYFTDDHSEMHPLLEALAFDTFNAALFMDLHPDAQAPLTLAAFEASRA